MAQSKETMTGLEIAVIGMAGRFPGAGDIDAYWDNLKNGVEGISFFSEAELSQTGMEPGKIKDSGYVGAHGALEAGESECFDSVFFDYTPKEAGKLDPQVRIFHESSWQALENAGYDPRSYPGLIGVYAGASANFNWEVLSRLPGTPGTAELDPFAIFLLSNREFLSTHVAYKLNLKGPVVTLQTACSTSLAAIHQACRALLTGECDMALAGGVTVNIPQKNGYIYKEGMIDSADGHCRAFDARANGTIGGSGIGIVVLKRLEAAIAERDEIYALVKGTAINNDGSRKVGYTAPSVEGQVEVIKAAMHMAEVEPASIGYIETHGTGTPLGDPVEINALEKAFNIEKKSFCALGAVKTNIGHLDSAAGIAGFIKTVLALKHRLIPPTLHYETPNPKIILENTPFYVNNSLEKWESSGNPLRAGVSSFGIGGTNVHVILEEWPGDSGSVGLRVSEPVRMSSGGTRGLAPLSNRQYQLILLSAKTETALERMTENLAEYFKKNLLNPGNPGNPTNPGPATALADAAYTLQVGRAAFKYRKMLVCAAVEEAIEILSSPGSDKIRFARVNQEKRPLVFMFPGQGAQYENMGLELYKSEPIFREEMDRCFEILTGLVEYDLKEILYPGTNNSHGSNRSHRSDRSYNTYSSYINQTEVAQPLIFIFEYALAKLLRHWGLEPYAMIGHSIGEYTAACLSGVFSLESAIRLVVKRGQLMQSMPPGAMLGVTLPENRLKPLLTNNAELSLAAVNAPSSCVVSGPRDVIEVFNRQMEAGKHRTRLLHTSHAFHSTMMDPILEEFREEVSRVELKKPQVPYISNVTGNWITGEDARDPAYWARHVRETVRFARGIEILEKETGAIFIEVGPGTTLSTFARRYILQKPAPGDNPGHPVINLVRHPDENIPDLRYLLDKVGQLWLNGKTIDWQAFYKHEQRSRKPLPAYSFDKIPYPVELSLYKEGLQRIARESLQHKKPDTADWFYVPLWEKSIKSVYPAGPGHTPGNWLVFTDEEGIGAGLVKRLEQEGHRVITVRAGTANREQDHRTYEIQPHRQEDYVNLFREIREIHGHPQRIIHMWSVKRPAPGSHQPGEEQNLGFYSLLHMAQAIGTRGITEDIGLTVITTGIQEVTGQEPLYPGEAAILGPIKVIPREYPHIRANSIDIILPGPGTREQDKPEEQLLAEIKGEITDETVALRGNHRWVQIFKPVRFEEPGKSAQPLKEKGVYLVTGGLGGIGFTLAMHLARTLKARLVLTGRNAEPDSEQEKKIREMEALGAEVVIERADVAREEQMRAVIARTRQRFGVINGVIHSAGIPDGAVIQARPPETAASALEAKVKGTLVLEELLKEEPLDFFVLCSSLNAIIAGIGQAAYSGANAFQDAFAHYKTREHGIFTVSINWDAWREIGMAAAAAGKKRSLELNQSLHPLFDRYEPGNSADIFISRMSVKKHWILDEHRILGKATLPGTAYLEMVRAASRRQNPGETNAIEISRVYFLQPLQVEDHEEKEVRTILQKSGNKIEFYVISRVNAAGDTWQEHARGQVKNLQAEAEPKKHDINKIAALCRQAHVTGTPGDSEPGEALLTFGPRWTSLKQAKLGTDQALVELELPGAFTPDLDLYKLHPALLDTALAGFFGSGAYYLPFSYKKIKINQPLAPRIFSHIKALEQDNTQKEFKHYNIVIMDEQGSELVEIEDYTLMAVPGDRIKNREITGKSTQTGVIHRNSELYRYTSPGLPDPGETREQEHGILPGEGIEVFQRVLSARQPQVAISTMDFHARWKQERTRSWEQIPGAGDEPGPGVGHSPTLHPRPQLSSKYVKPGKEIEKKIARVFQDFLGVEQVGIHDNFFELGADSLVLVQVNGQIQKELKKDISVVNIYAFPTVKLLSDFLSSREAPAGITAGENQQLKHRVEKGKNKLEQRKERRKKMPTHPHTETN